MLNINKGTICIDTDHYEPYSLGSDQVYIDYPTRFPTVEFYLEETPELNKAADATRMELGFLPMFNPGPNGEYDDNGWYTFYIGINGFSDTMVNSCIEYIVEGGLSEDVDSMGTIDLTEEEQIKIYNVLNEQCVRLFGKTCEDLLEEARLEMIEQEEYEAKHKEVV